MRNLTQNEMQTVSGGNYVQIVSLATSTMSGLISGGGHKNWAITVSVDALLNGAVAYFMAPAAIISTVSLGVVFHTIAYLGADYASTNLT